MTTRYVIHLSDAYRVPDWIYCNVPWVNIQVDAYEVKKQELMQENADLRALLRSMQVKP